MSRIGVVIRVQAWYAVKCNPEFALMKLLAAYGCGFDCASAGRCWMLDGNIAKARCRLGLSIVAIPTDTAIMASH